MNIYEKLMLIQSELKAPKNQHNSYAGFYYRSCEDILEGVKPLLKKYKCTMVIEDEIKLIGNRYYLQAVTTIYDIESGEDIKYIKSSALARETETKTKMDEAQLTGSASSYARKYALNGLFAIDDTKDSDSQEKPIHASIKEEIQKYYKMINSPSDKLTAWIANVELHDQAELAKGLKQIKNILQEQK